MQSLSHLSEDYSQIWVSVCSHIQMWADGDSLSALKMMSSFAKAAKAEINVLIKM